MIIRFSIRKQRYHHGVRRDTSIGHLTESGAITVSHQWGHTDGVSFGVTDPWVTVAGMKLISITSAEVTLKLSDSIRSEV